MSLSSEAFFIIQMLKGYGKVGFRLDSRFPLTLPILHRLIQVPALVTNSPDKFACAGYNACYVGETTRHFSTLVREHLVSRWGPSHFQTLREF